LKHKNLKLKRPNKYKNKKLQDQNKLSSEKMHCLYGVIYNNLCPSKKIQNSMDLSQIV
jgi:hypothetical protein